MFKRRESPTGSRQDFCDFCDFFDFGELLAWKFLAVAKGL